MADHGDSPTPDYNGSSVTVIRRIDQAQPAVVYGLLAILLAAVFVPMSLYRLVDGDEGTYLLVSRLVVEGQLPYHDFFYPQMFLLPYVYGGWMKLVGYSWYGARLLSAVFSIALGLLVYRQAARLAGARAWAVRAVRARPRARAAANRTLPLDRPAHVRLQHRRQPGHPDGLRASRLDGPEERRRRAAARDQQRRGRDELPVPRHLRAEPRVLGVRRSLARVAVARIDDGRLASARQSRADSGLSTVLR